jgi:hypothetical protein
MSKMGNYEVHIEWTYPGARQWRFDKLHEAIAEAQRLCAETYLPAYVTRTLVRCRPTVVTEPCEAGGVDETGH